jgi:phosphate transport system substrate-binding protein
VSIQSRCAEPIYARQENNLSRTHTLIFSVLLLCAAASAQQLNGAGATFPNPLYQKWFTEYGAARPKVQINYQSLGSGAGIRQLIAGTIDFGASDAPMSDAELAKCPTRILHIPTAIGAVVPSYNLAGVKQELRFTPELLAGIFLGKITSWRDPAIAEVNPGVELPNLPILVIHRADSSGSTYVFTDYLSKVSPEWNSKVGHAISVRWPVGPGAKGNEGVGGAIRRIDGSIGYIELTYAVQNHISYGQVRNLKGNFVRASQDSITAAAAPSIPQSDYRVSITNAEGKDAYPIAGFTWLLIPQQSKDPEKGRALHDFLAWMLKDGEREAPSLTYVPLPDPMIKKLQTLIQTIH